MSPKLWRYRMSKLGMREVLRYVGVASSPVRDLAAERDVKLRPASKGVT